jgi:small redox-active disulfide protein 2
MALIQVLGTGCPKCRKLAEHAEQAAKALGIDCHIDEVTDINRILSFGVMMTPALVVDGQVKVMGRVPTVDELKAMLA